MSINDLLLDAVNKNNPSGVRSALEDGADVNYRVLFGISMLMIAAGRGHTDVAQILLSEGADVNSEDNLGYTPLTVAQQGGHLDMIKLLKDNGGLSHTTKLSERLVQRQLNISFSCGKSDGRVKGLTTGLSLTGLGARISGSGLSYDEIKSMQGKTCSISFDEIDLGILPVPGRVTRVEKSYDSDYEAFVGIAFNPHSIFFSPDEIEILKEKIRKQVEQDFT